MAKAVRPRRSIPSPILLLQSSFFYSFVIALAHAFNRCNRHFPQFYFRIFLPLEAFLPRDL